MNEKRARGDGRIFLRGKTWWIQYYAHGAQIRESARTADERKALKELRKRVGAVANGIATDNRSIRYEQLRDAYLWSLEADEAKSLRRDAAGQPYLECVRRLDSFFAGFRAIEIDADQIRRFQKEHRAELSNGSINRSISALRAMFSLAQREQRIQNLPYFPMLKESRPRQGTLSAEKYPELLAALPEYLRLVVTIGFRTGSRLGEILGLRWKNILWMDKLIRVEDSKNSDAREIPFAGELERALREQYARRQEGCDRVCFRLDGKGHAQAIGNFRKAWRRACEKIGLGAMKPVVDAAGQTVLDKPRYSHSKPRPKMRYEGLIFHDLRRSFISDAEHAGAPRGEVMKMSGHRSESVYKRYAIENRKQRRAALDQIEDFRLRELGDNSGTIEQSPKTGDPVIN